MSMKQLLLVTSVVALAASGTAFAAGSDTASNSSASNSMSLAKSMHASTSAATTQAKVSQAQSALKQKGLYSGPVDGRLGPKTRHAISQFQRESGLKQTAQLDARTMTELAGSGGTSRTNSGRSATPPEAPNPTMGAPATGGTAPSPGGTGETH